MAESKLVQLNFENNSYQYNVSSICRIYVYRIFNMLAKPWLHSDIKSC